MGNIIKNILKYSPNFPILKDILLLFCQNNCFSVFIIKLLHSKKIIIMDKSKEEALNNFVDNPEENKKKKDKKERVVMDEREGLIERVDKVYITEDGRRLLREHY
jgi:hypothetical protein